jgi:hypothetical protein
VHESVKRWAQHNPNIFWILVAAQSGADQNPDTVRGIYGYFGVIPLRKAACKALDEEQLDGMSFTTDHICGSNDVPEAYYIAGDFGATAIALMC